MKSVFFSSDYKSNPCSWSKNCKVRKAQDRKDSPFSPLLFPHLPSPQPSKEHAKILVHESSPVESAVASRQNLTRQPRSPLGPLPGPGAPQPSGYHPPDLWQVDSFGLFSSFIENGTVEPILLLSLASSAQCPVCEAHPSCCVPAVFNACPAF